MKYIFSLVAFLFAFTTAFAQIEKPKVTTNPTPAKPKPAPQAKVNPATVLTLKIKSDTDAEIFVDDESRGQASAGVIKKIFLGKGEFQLKFVSNINANDVFVTTYVVTSQDINSEKIFTVDLVSISSRRIALAEKKACPNCHGNGTYNTNDPCTKCGSDGKEDLTCQECSGEGLVHPKCSGGCNGSGRIIFTNSIGTSTTNRRCTTCDGDGKEDRKCHKCAGTGKLLGVCSQCNGVGKIVTRHSCPH